MRTQEEFEALYPEHAKQGRVIEKTAAILSFLEWLQKNKFIELAVQDQKTEWLSPSFTPHRSLVAEFYDLDENKLEAERKTMIQAMRQG